MFYNMLTVDTILVATTGDFLYIQGGTAIIPNRKYKDGVTEDRTFVLSLKKSWSTNDLDLDKIGYQNPGYYDVASSAMAMWTSPGNKELLFWGGLSPAVEGNKGSRDARLQKFTPDSPGSKSGSWKSGPSEPTVESSQQPVYRTFGGSWTQCNGLGFYLGGAVSNVTDSHFPNVGSDWTTLSGLIIYDMASDTWQNRSTKSFGNGSGSYTWGSAACLPTLGTNGKGIVVFIGGSHANLLQNQQASQGEMLPMNEINFYDIGSGRFYKQRTTGATPQPRHGGCIVAAKAGNSRTYEVVVYGGCQQPEDTYILTIPGFRWFSADSANGAPENDRQYHSCAIIGKGARQMVAYGGYPLALGGKSWQDFNSTTNRWGDSSLQVLDMTELKWKETYDSDAPSYQQPTMVRNWYKESGLKNVSWNSDSVRALFANLIENPLSDEPLTANSPSSAGAPIGAIVGGVVGAIVVLILIAGSLLYLCWYKPRRQGPSSTHEPMQPEYVGSSNRQSQGIANLYQPPPQHFDAHTSQLEQQHAYSSKRCAELPSPPSSPPPHKENETRMGSHSEGTHIFCQELPAYCDSRAT
ncbi:hypothetical protein MCOR03_005802 [Pyricularia oryzae]|nr:hypothetical protein MCOR21_009975 [Pyricularia oryzae]KAI6520398.1 hypothetical protein MCOR10_006381 [Pyricularia oryzae]KAI6557460.1 hypothetical protein MCOR03_005802 [Pyricularia oryzae]KAI6568818.1 hypothetical protein MCOR09_005673 [Pyricularia oryzae]KAI6595095.1 hypothetical protein MCOR12_006619 [Pyricularia oryzae]